MFEQVPVIVDEVLDEFADPTSEDAALPIYYNTVYVRNCALVTL